MMRRTPKIAAMTLGALAALTAATVAQQNPAAAPGARGAAGTPETVVISGSLDWLESSQIAPKIEGVIESMEFRVGMRVQQGQEIARLHDEIAKLTVAKSDIVAKSTGEIAKADAQRKQAMATLARLINLEKKGRGFVSEDEMSKAEADVAFADALKQVATERQAVDRAELALAAQNLENHTIRAPFNGIVIERLKNPEESVRSNEAIIQLGKTDKFQFVGWVGIEQAQRIRPGDAVQFRAGVPGANLPVEEKVFTGRIASVSPDVSPVHNAERRILAEIDNPPDVQHPELELFQGMTGDLTVFLNTAGAAAAPARAVDPAAVPAAAPAAAGELPALPATPRGR